MSVDETLAIYDRMAREYSQCNASDSYPGFEGFLAVLKRTANVLDLGCGPGTAAARLAAAGHSVLAIDGSAEMVAMADAKPGVTARQATFEDIPGLGEFDGIWAAFSLLHAPRADFPRHLEALHELCTDDAPFALGMKLGKGEGPDPLGRFYTYYSEAELRKHLTQAGFHPTEAWYGTDKGMAGTMDSWIILLSRA